MSTLYSKEIKNTNILPTSYNNKQNKKTDLFSMKIQANAKNNEHPFYEYMRNKEINENVYQIGASQGGHYKPTKNPEPPRFANTLIRPSQSKMIKAKAPIISHNNRIISYNMASNLSNKKTVDYKKEYQFKSMKLSNNKSDQNHFTYEPILKKDKNEFKNDFWNNRMPHGKLVKPKLVEPIYSRYEDKMKSNN